MNPTVSARATREAAGEREPPDRRIERREEAVLDEHPGARQAVHERRLAGVRVADERDRGERDAPALVAMDPPRRRRRERRRSTAMRSRTRRRSTSSCVSPGPRVADAAADAREVRPLARQARQQVLELRQLHLQLALGLRARCAKMSRMSALRSMTLQRRLLLEVALLGGRERVVEDTTLALARRRSVRSSSTLPWPR